MLLNSTGKQIVDARKKGTLSNYPLWEKSCDSNIYCFTVCVDKTETLNVTWILTTLFLCQLPPYNTRRPPSRRGPPWRCREGHTPYSATSWIGCWPSSRSGSWRRSWAWRGGAPQTPGTWSTEGGCSDQHALYTQLAHLPKVLLINYCDFDQKSSVGWYLPTRATTRMPRKTRRALHTICMNTIETRVTAKLNSLWRCLLRLPLRIWNCKMKKEVSMFPTSTTIE